MISGALLLPRIDDVFRILQVETILLPQTLNCGNLVTGMKVSLGFVDSAQEGKRLPTVGAGLSFAAYLSFAGAA
jgi:hypothetical protein